MKGKKYLVLYFILMLIVILVSGTVLFCVYYPLVLEVSRFNAIDWLDEKLTGESAPFVNNTVIDDFHILAVYSAMHLKDCLSHPLLLKLMILLCVILWTVGNNIFVYFLCICKIMKRSVLLLLAIIIFLISCLFGGWLVYEDTFDPISNSTYVFDYQWIDKHRLAIQYSSDEERAKYTTFQIYKLVFITSRSIGNIKNVYNGSQTCARTADQADSSGILDGPPTSIAAANKSLIYE
ncbi:Protein CBG14725 [Caenorhabditis briggsae]|uniref:Protein CBG14725 n=2 Tax=Caenorhabditis briggsae TaxID=6238 RepID=A8XKJ2_CAEBR|nr:Protein CBG14725 [Caenorhabditis briggsae]CAP33166.2 Protein CBG14725 [Caenorhabditis briggsae]